MKEQKIYNIPDYLKYRFYLYTKVIGAHNQNPIYISMPEWLKIDGNEDRYPYNEDMKKINPKHEECKDNDGNNIKIASPEKAINEIYNKTIAVHDKLGNNTYNIKKGYNSSLDVLNLSTEDTYTDKFVFNKSFKLTNEKNVKDDNVLNTNKSSISIFFDYDKDSLENGSAIYFVSDMADEISDKNMDTHRIYAVTDTINTCTIGGKEYNINLNEILEHVGKWFGEHTEYSTTNEVLASENANDINSLMAVYVKDTAGCFVK